MAYLVFTRKGEEIQRIPLDRPVTIGRSLECDVWFDDRKLSRKHCRLERVETDWVVLDLGSHNGVIVRGEKVPRQLLVDGDVIEVGGFKITFHSDSLVPKRPTAPVKEDRLPIEEELLRLKGGNEPSRPLPTPSATFATVKSRSKTSQLTRDPSGRQPTPEEVATQDTSAVLPALKLKNGKPPKPPITLAFKRPPAKPIVHGSEDEPAGLSQTHRTGIIVAAGAVAAGLLALLVYVVI